MKFLLFLWFVIENWIIALMCTSLKDFRLHCYTTRWDCLPGNISKCCHGIPTGVFKKLAWSESTTDCLMTYFGNMHLLSWLSYAAQEFVSAAVKGLNAKEPLEHKVLNKEFLQLSSRKVLFPQKNQISSHFHFWDYALKMKVFVKS